MVDPYREASEASVLETVRLQEETRRHEATLRAQKNEVRQKELWALLHSDGIKTMLILAEVILGAILIMAAWARFFR